MEKITKKQLLARINASVAEIKADYSEPSDRMEAVYDEVDSWDWMIYTYYLDQLVPLIFKMDMDKALIASQLVGSATPLDIKTTMVYKFLVDTIQTAILNSEI